LKYYRREIFIRSAEYLITQEVTEYCLKIISSNITRRTTNPQTTQTNPKENIISNINSIKIYTI